MACEKTLLIAVRDLMFSSRVITVAQAAGVEFRVLRDVTAIASAEGVAMIVDLNQDGFLEAAAKWKAMYEHAVMGFVAHVDTTLIQRARGLGITRVLTRGQFVQQVEAIVRALNV